MQARRERPLAEILTTTENIHEIKPKSHFIKLVILNITKLIMQTDKYYQFEFPKPKVKRRKKYIIFVFL